VELLDFIASFVDTHCDLVSLALTCCIFARIVLPAHAPYRAIRIHSRRGPAPWEAIAARPDRAAGVRCLVLFDQSGEARFLPERAPSIALGPPAGRSSAKPGRGACKTRGEWNAETLEAAASAVRLMPNLDTVVFTASSRRGRAPECRAAEARFWAAVAAVADGSLKHLEYALPLRAHAPPMRSMPGLQSHPVRLSGLELVWLCER